MVIWDTNNTAPTHTIETLQQKAPSMWSAPAILTHTPARQTQWERLEDTTQALARR